MSKKKKPVLGAHPPGGKKPRIQEDPSGRLSRCPAWRFGLLQLQGPWHWSAHTADSLRALHDKLKSCECSTWEDLGRGGSHGVPLDQLAPEARRCLEALKLDDLDELYSLRLSGTERIWGILDRNILKILWWDPNHEVCPSVKKHT